MSGDPRYPMPRKMISIMVTFFLAFYVNQCFGHHGIDIACGCSGLKVGGGPGPGAAAGVAVVVVVVMVAME